MATALVQPSPEQQIQIRKSLKEDINTRDRDLEIIKEWLRQQPHLPDTWDESRLMTFLRGCSFSLEKCKRKLDMYFTMRAALPELFANRDITRPELQNMLEIAQAAPLPGLTPDGKRVTILRASVDDIETPNIADAMKLVLMYGDVRLEAEKVGVLGDVFILDASVASVKHFGKVSPSIVKKFLICVTEAYPVKLKEVHVINISPFVDFLFNWVKPFLKDKITKRVHFHSDMESLYKFVPQELMPEEYGGFGGKLKDHNDQWIEILKEYRPWFKAQENIKADESKRPGKPTNYDDLFGVEGSFRQLSID